MSAFTQSDQDGLWLTDDAVVDTSGSDIDDQLVALMNRYERPLHTYLMAILRDEEVARDCTQDVFIRAYHHLGKGKPIQGSWLYTVARHRAMDEFRRRRRVYQDEEMLQTVPAAPTSIDDTLDLQEVMSRIPPGDREVLYLFEIAGFKTHEIAEILGLRGAAVRQRLVRARERFRAVYQAPRRLQPAE